MSGLLVFAVVVGAEFRVDGVDFVVFEDAGEFFGRGVHQGLGPGWVADSCGGGPVEFALVGLLEVPVGFGFEAVVALAFGAEVGRVGGSAVGPADGVVEFAVVAGTGAAVERAFFVEQAQVAALRGGGQVPGRGRAV